MVQILKIVKYTYPPESGFVGHSHPHFQLWYIVHGHAIFDLDDQKHELTERMLILAKPNQKHQMNVPGLGGVLLIDLKFVISDEALLEGVMGLPSVMSDHAGWVRQQLETIRDETRYKLRYSMNMAECDLQKMLFGILNENYELILDQDHLFAPIYDSNTHELVRKIAQYIEGNYAEEITLELISRVFGYNMNYCSTLFKQETGITIRQYINMVRIRNAVEWIRKGQGSFEQIAENVGFKNVQHFNRVFKRVTGYTPAKIRDKERDGLYFDEVNWKNHTGMSNQEKSEPEGAECCWFRRSVNMRKPMIGIVPLVDVERESYWMLPGYMEGIRQAGGVPVMLPLTPDEGELRQMVDTFDGFLFTGGQDVSPSVYGAPRSRQCGECS